MPMVRVSNGGTALPYDVIITQDGQGQAYVFEDVNGTITMSLLSQWANTWNNLPSGKKFYCVYESNYDVKIGHSTNAGTFYGFRSGLDIMSPVVTKHISANADYVLLGNRVSYSFIAIGINWD